MLPAEMLFPAPFNWLQLGAGWVAGPVVQASHRRAKIADDVLTLVGEDFDEALVPAPVHRLSDPAGGHVELAVEH